VVCNPVYTSYHTRPKADRLTALDVLRQGRKRIFLLNEEAFGYLEKVALSKAAREVLPQWRSEKVWEEAAFVKRLDQALPNLNTQQRTALLGAAAVAAYHAEKGVPIVDTLVCDDAAVFHWLTRALMLCWVHDGRAYTKLEPVIALHRQHLEDFRKRYWEYYDQLLAYREKPTARNTSGWKASSISCSQPRQAIMIWISALPKPAPRRLHYCWYFNTLNCLCITMLLNWRFDSE
jgi:hypothetical protein